MTTQDFTKLKEIKGIGKKRYDTITSILLKNNETLESLFLMSPETIKEHFSLPINVAQAISNYTSTNKEISKAQQENPVSTERKIQQLDLVSPQYPLKLKQMLGDKAPQTLYVWGNLDLLKLPSVGFCGSRNVSEKGLEVTADTAKQLVELGWVIVSGHARGVDATAHRVALESGGATIIVIPQGFDDFKLRRELKNVAKPEQLLIISEYESHARWTVGRAMTRNKTIIGMSDAMVLIEARMEGGTFSAGKDALKLGMPLFVAEYQTTTENAAGNRYFIQKGAQPLYKSKETQRANIKSLRDVVEKQHLNSTIQSPTPLRQLSLLED